MKLQKLVGRTTENVTYMKYVIVLPSNIVKKANWKKGYKINAVVRNNKIILSD